MNLDNVKIPSNRRFGLFFSIIFSLIFLYIFFVYKNSYSFIFIIVAITFFLVSILKPIILKPLNISWMYFGFALGRVFNPIILGVVFFFIVTPIGLIMKIIQRDELKIKKKKSSSFWLIANKTNNESNFEKQF